MFNSNFLRVDEDHRSRARPRQRFGHPHPADRAEEPGLRLLLKSDERFATAWNRPFLKGLNKAAGNPRFITV